MFCTKCGREIPDEKKYCPVCHDEKNQRTTPLYRSIFITGIGSMICAILALHIIIITVGILLGFVSVYLFFRFRSQTKESSYLAFALAMGISGILSSIIWLIYTVYFI